MLRCVRAGQKSQGCSHPSGKRRIRSWFACKVASRSPRPSHSSTNKRSSRCCTPAWYSSGSTCGRSSCADHQQRDVRMRAQRVGRVPRERDHLALALAHAARELAQRGLLAVFGDGQQHVARAAGGDARAEMRVVEVVHGSTMPSSERRYAKARARRAVLARRRSAARGSRGRAAEATYSSAEGGLIARVSASASLLRRHRSPDISSRRLGRGRHARRRPFPACIASPIEYFRSG